MRRASSTGSCRFALDAFLQRLPLDERHDIVEDAVDGTGIEDRENVRVRQLGGDLDFAEEAVGAEGGAHLAAHHLDGDLAAVLEILGQVDDRHAALAEGALDPVAAGEGACGAGRSPGTSVAPVGGRTPASVGVAVPQWRQKSAPSGSGVWQLVHAGAEAGAVIGRGSAWRETFW